MASYAADIETSGLLEQMKLQERPVLHNMGFKDMNTGRKSSLVIITLTST